MIESRNKMMEGLSKIADYIFFFIFSWFFEILIGFFLGIYIIFYKWLIYIFFPYLFWLLMSMFFPPKQEGDLYFHKKRDREIKIKKSRWFFSSGTYDTFYKGTDIVQKKTDYYFNRNLKLIDGISVGEFIKEMSEEFERIREEEEGKE